MQSLFFNWLQATFELIYLALPCLFVFGTTLLQERRLTLNEVAKRAGVNPSTAWRWALKGVRGVKLETFSYGVKRYSSSEALERFSERCTAAAAGGCSAPTVRTPAQRERDIDRAEQELARMGV